ncbi:TrbG/VirB9 family P-type conjugative transfer protein [Variovorax saccharolyticus]|uniref:TrbG/VirB9 family P-type conjugative transfer protein n=1 Tax=Variovorax saccharolyticus TaxID=3053516 RepID=UPI0025749896|nr:TrbG/VirB9 family P-type conjugative transfer protein [Variovorax sp. J22R187]MDM0022684.1 TrbG/VirB9 family P-type conjugative transfer protein [Variovorax sp. J22R187]
MRGLAAIALFVGVFSATTLLSPGVAAGTVPPAGSVDARIRVVAYNPDDVVELQGYVGFQIHMQWAEGEEFVNLGSGDNAAFDVGAERNHFFIKPREARATTNLTVLTNRRAYHFDYVVAAAAPTGKAARRMVYSIRFTYPGDDARAAAAERERLATEARMKKAVAERPRNNDYWFCGSATLKPMGAYDDGVQTRLRFQTRSEFPALFVQNDDGSESLLNFNIEDDEVVIHRVARRFVLRRGKLVGCVVNQSFAGGGARTRSSTSIPGVERTTPGAAP